MSTLRTNTIGNVAGTQSTDVLNVINGSAKAWVNFNGTGTVAIRAGYNVTSITDNGTGNYTVNFTNAFANTNYCGVASSGAYTADAIGQGVKSVSQCSIWNVDSRNYGYVDTDSMNVVFFR